MANKWTLRDFRQFHQEGKRNAYAEGYEAGIHMGKRMVLDKAAEEALVEELAALVAQGSTNPYALMNARAKVNSVVDRLLAAQP